MKNLASINDPEDLVTKQYVDESLEVQISNEQPTDERINLWIDEDAPNTSPAGESAYEIAVRNGFKGTEQEWLESLKGSAGKDGKPGRDGVQVNDSVVSKTETWSSQMITDRSCIPFKRSGLAVYCDPVPGSELKYESDVELKQERPGETGTPSNPNRFIIQKGSTLKIANDNILDVSSFESNSQSEEGPLAVVESDGTVRLDGMNYEQVRVESATFYLPEGEVVAQSWDFYPNSHSPHIYLTKVSNVDLSWEFTPEGTVKIADPKEKYKVIIDIPAYCSDFFKISLSVKPLTGFVKYSELVYPTTFSEPIGAGLVDWLHKKLVTFGSFMLVNNPDYVVSGYNGEVDYRPPFGSIRIDMSFDPVCEISKMRDSINGISIFWNGSMSFSKKMSDSMGGLEGVKAYIRDHPFKIYYKAEQPVIQTITVGEIDTSFSNSIVVSTDNGVTEVSGLESPKVALPAAVAAMNAQVDNMTKEMSFAIREGVDSV